MSIVYIDGVVMRLRVAEVALINGPVGSRLALYVDEHVLLIANS